MTPRVLCFDFGGTLDADGIPCKVRFFACFAGLGVSVDAETFYQAYYRADDPLVARDCRGQAYADTLRDLGLGIARGLGLDAGIGREAAARFLEHSVAHAAQIRPVLTSLKTRFRIGVVSNFYGNLDRALEATGLADLVEVPIDSVRVGVEKPDPAIFRAALDAFGAAPEEAAMIGDSLPRDVAGAEAIGMMPIWLAPAEARGEARTRIQGIHELEAVLA